MGFIFAAGEPPASGEIGDIVATGSITPRSLPDRFKSPWDVRDFGAIGDGASHALNTRFGSLAAARLVYPFVTDLADEIDWAAIQHACNQWACESSGNFFANQRGGVYISPGTYIVNRAISFSGSTFFEIPIADWTLGGPITFTKTAHGLPAGTGVSIGPASGTLPSAMAPPWTTHYWVMEDGLTANTFRLSTTPGGGGTAITCGAAGTATNFYFGQYIQGQGHIYGERGASVLKGNFDGFIFDYPSEVGDLYSGLIEGLCFYNAHGTGGGCIRWYRGNQAIIKNCEVKGFYGIILQGAIVEECNIESIIESVVFNGNSPSSTAWLTYGIGCTIGPNCRLWNCTFMLWDQAIIMGGSQCGVYTCRFETNNWAIKAGRYVVFNSYFENPHAHHGSVIENISFESNIIDIRITNANGLKVRDVISQMNHIVGIHEGKCSLSLRSASNVFIENYVISGTGVPPFGGIYFDGDMAGHEQRCTFIDVRNGKGVVVASGAEDMSGVSSIRSLGVTTSYFGPVTCTIDQLATVDNWCPVGTTRWVNNASQSITTAWGTVLSTTPGGNTCPYFFSGSNWHVGIGQF